MEGMGKDFIIRLEFIVPAHVDIRWRFEFSSHIMQIELLKIGGGDDGGLTWHGSSKHTAQYTDDMLWNCVPETCIVLLVNATLINSMKGKKRKCENLTTNMNMHILSFEIVKK